jgi:hypothetical protein
MTPTVGGACDGASPWSGFLDVRAYFADVGVICIFSAQVPRPVRPADDYLTMFGPYVCTDFGGGVVETGGFTLKRRH